MILFKVYFWGLIIVSSSVSMGGFFVTSMFILASVNTGTRALVPQGPPLKIFEVSPLAQVYRFHNPDGYELSSSKHSLILMRPIN